VANYNDDDVDDDDDDYKIVELSPLCLSTCEYQWDLTVATILTDAAVTPLSPK